MDRPSKPDIFRYHDYRDFLKDWLAWLKASQSSFSLRALATKADLALGYLPMVIKRARSLSPKALAKLGPALSLSPSERSYLELLVRLGDAESQEERLAALEKMKRFSGYRKHNAREAEAFQYLTHWYYVAIREMAALPGFKPDASWIRPRLRSRVPLPEIDKALKFLIDNKYIEVLADGSVRPPEKSIDCMGGVYKVALTQMHQEMLALAGKSIENTPSTDRSILGYTLALDENGLDQARDILSEAFERIRGLAQARPNPKTVFHAELALFPLTKDESEEDEDV